MIVWLLLRPSTLDGLDHIKEKEKLETVDETIKFLLKDYCLDTDDKELLKILHKRDIE